MVRVNFRKKGLSKYGPRIERGDPSAIEANEEKSVLYKDVPVNVYSSQEDDGKPRLNEEELGEVEDALDLE